MNMQIKYAVYSGWGLDSGWFVCNTLESAMSLYTEENEHLSFRSAIRIVLTEESDFNHGVTFRELSRNSQSPLPGVTFIVGPEEQMPDFMLLVGSFNNTNYETQKIDLIEKLKRFGK